MNSLPIVRRLAVLYGLLLVLVILAANRGLIPMWWAFRRLSWADKLGHFLLIGTLAFLVNLALGARRWNLGRFSGLRGSLWISVAVVLEEISQHWMKYRAFELADLAADFLGILVFGQLARWWLAWRERVTLRDQSPVADLKTVSADHWERRV
jgi:hypothetical protein